MTSDDELSIDLKMGRRGTLTEYRDAECGVQGLQRDGTYSKVGFLSPIDPPRTRFGTVAPPPV